jgi:Tfp pilus assembly protein PilF
MACALSRNPILVKTVAIVMICCMGVFVFGTAGFCTSGSSQAAPELSAHEKRKLVRRAVAQYERKEIAQARQSLERARTAFPENYAVPYYLGLIYLEQGDRAGAIAQWQQYVKMDPQSENSLNIRKNITLLLREQAREDARQAVARKANPPAGPADDRTVAVTNFKNLGSDKLGPLGKGMASMLISDLSQLSDLQVVDRIKLHALLEKMKPGASGVVDPKTASRAGKLLRAGHAISGALADMKNERMFIASAVAGADRKAGIATQEVNGELKQFYDLEKQIACQIIEDLGRDCDAAPAGFNKIHTRSMPALLAYSYGLHYFDEENYGRARERFQRALEKDPRFDLAAAALLATPTADMVPMDRSQMVSRASSRGLSSAVAGTAVAGSASTDGSTAAVTEKSGKVGFPPMIAIIAGAAAVSGGVALAAGGGGSSGGGSESKTNANLTGNWRGPWTGAAGTGEVTFSLTQTGDAVSGTASVTGMDCLTAGSVSGNVSGNNANLSIQSGGETVSLNSAYDNSAKTLTGRWNFTASALGCTGDTGDYSATVTGDADVGW